MSTQTQDATRTLAEVNPADLIVGANVRLEARVDDQLVESIRERGVISPVIAYRNEDGALVVLAGQRRTLASIEAERETIPVVIVPAPDESGRLIDQVVENDARAALTESERVAAFGQMSLLGMTASQIAKATGSKREKVATAIAVVKAPAARAAYESNALTLEDAAAMAEFEGDEEATAKILARQPWESVTHIAQRIRDERDREARMKAFTDSLAADGRTVVQLADLPENCRLTSLCSGDEDQAHMSEEEHADCPGAALAVTIDWRRILIDRATGEPADDQDAAQEAQEAWLNSVPDDEDDQEAPYDEDRRRGPVAVPVCTDPTTYGHEPRVKALAPRAPMSEEEAEAEAERRRIERRRVIDNNKAWESAERVRRTWLKNFAAGKSAPKGSAAFLLTMIDRHAHTLADHRDWKVTEEVFGTTSPSKSTTPASEPRTLRLTLLLALTRCEGQTSRENWRTANSTTRDYLLAISEWGYPLSNVERLAAGLPETPDEATQDDEDDDQAEDDQE